MTEKKKMKPAMILKKYFKMNMEESKAEIMPLSKEHREDFLELAQLAAVELGVEVDLG